MAEPGSRVRDGMTSEFAHRIWPADSRSLPAIRAEVHDWLGALSLDEDDEDDLVLAVNEAASNSIEHAYPPGTLDGTVELTFWIEDRGICLQIVDHGTWRDPSRSDSSRGRGILLMQRLMTVAVIDYEGRGTRVRLSMSLPDDGVARIAAGADR